ncbi:transcriptional regulator [Vitiosangium sp. GDMCC 1.1324]|nr:transcriptional regulator [Vitiosangium sp. GDMCC 1.1324]
MQEGPEEARLRRRAEVARKVRLKSGVYGRVERGAMVPSVPTLRRICETLAICSDALLSLGTQAHEATAPTPPPAAGEHPELNRIIHILQGWPPDVFKTQTAKTPSASRSIAGFSGCPGARRLRA